MRSLWIVLSILCLSGSARAESVRLLLAVGARRGAQDEAPLRYAVDDARRVRDVFVTLGNVRTEHALLVSDPRAGELHGALERMQALARSYPKRDVTFIFYFSGHGDKRALHLSGDVVSMSDVASKIEAVPAGLHIAIVDACRTMRDKGASAERAFAVRLKPGETANGAAWMYAAADGEAAQESDALGGAVFTHYLVSGLRGAADRDGDRRVTLAEVYAFSHYLTLHRSAMSSGSVQRPAAALDLVERAPVVLTETTRRSAVLSLPRGADIQYLVYAAGARAIVGEIWGNGDRFSELALAPGRYLVHRRFGSHSSAAEVVLAQGERRVVPPDKFRKIEDHDVRSKGGDLILRPHALSAAYGLNSGSLSGHGHGGRLLYTYRLGAFALGGGAGGGVAQSSPGQNDVEYAWVGTELRFEYRHELSALDARIGVRTTTQYGWQTLTRKDADRIERGGYSGETGFSGVAAGGGPSARVLVPIASGFVEIGGTFDVLATRRGTRMAAETVGAVEGGGGVTF
jgi:hypothetical protein